MTLFVLLVAILIERFQFLPSSWQFSLLMSRYHEMLFGDEQLKSKLMLVLAVVFPTLVVILISWLINDFLWGALNLLLWLSVAVICFSHQEQRKAFKAYMQSACRDDVQGCFHHAEELEPSQCLEVVSEYELGAKVGQSIAWVNYRYFGAIALYLIVCGPIGALFYGTVRFYSELSKRNELHLPWVDCLLFVLDWIPSRVFTFGYVLSGKFSQGFAMWLSTAMDVKCSARDMVTKVAMAAETVAETSQESVCVQSTLSLLQLSKRNLILLIIVVALLTIFGVIK
ncbi:beta-lactamase regulator AmpE [Shewanella surugensis]|uniref:Beta-lactamase regulator AmpE n=1 Tax=Shewanella surugensis TaxID=212020 RepID=A0ABT0LF32_9GAMM|nr:beta-lactamase regulator AmpE [Shewanella surugensis]MCL1125766.1 beta-lactamase regulator AmpE [Shewanella surugensis]